MVTKTEVIQEINLYLEQSKEGGFFNNTLDRLLKVYKKLSSNVLFDIQFVVRKNRHLLAVKLPDYILFFDIDLTKDELVVRFEHVECYFYSEDEFFALNKEKILMAFFRGKYKVIYYFNQKGKTIYKELYWDDDELSRCNLISDKKKVIDSSEEVKGKCYVD